MVKSLVRLVILAALAVVAAAPVSASAAGNFPQTC
jgi:hypothetical protein